MCLVATLIHHSPSTNPPWILWLRACDQELCVYGLGLFGHWHSWSCVLIDYFIGGIIRTPFSITARSISTFSNILLHALPSGA